MKLILKGISASIFAFGLVYQSSALAITSYEATGSFYADSLEAFSYDDNTGDEIFVDTFLSGSPFNITSSSFTLRFTVDESVDGNVPVFSPSAFFSGAVSDISLDINGVSVFSGTPQLATVSQFPGDFGGTLPASWGWSSFPESGALALPSLEVFDVNSFESLGNINPSGFSFRLLDSTRTIYDDISFVDLITLALGDFDSTLFQLFWDNQSAFEEEPEFGLEPTEITYTVVASIDNLTSTAVPVPAAAWLFGSAILGLVRFRMMRK